MAGIAARVRKGSLWIAASRGLSNILGLIATIVLARLLVPADFGIVAIGSTIQEITLMLTDIAVANALIHQEDPDERHLSTAWTLNALRGLLIGILFWFAGPWVAGFYGDERLTLVMAAIGVTVFLNGLGNPMLAMRKRDLVFHYDFWVQLSNRIAMILVSVAVAVFSQSYIALIAGLIAAQFAGLVASYVMLPFRPRITLSRFSDLFAFSGWLTLAQFVQTTNWRLDPLIIGKMLDAGTLGLFTVGNKLARAPTRDTTSPLTNTLFPAFRQLRDNKERLKSAYQRAQTLVTAIALPAGVLVALLAQPLILVTMGEKWRGAVMVVQVLAVIYALQTLGSQSRPLAMATGNTRLLFNRSLQGLALRLPIVITGLYLDGLRGMLFGRVLVGLISILLDFDIVKKEAGLSFTQQLIVNWRTIFSVALMSAVLLVLEPYLDMGDGILALIETLLVSGVIGGSTYLLSCAALWLLCGRPEGPEREVEHVLSRVLGLMRARRASQRG
jgi:O-antigen/teichoic acid export membrane protein